MTPEDDLLREAEEWLAERGPYNSEYTDSLIRRLATRLQPAAHQPAAPAWGVSREQIADAIARSYGSDPEEFAPLAVMCTAENQPVIWREVFLEQADAVLALPPPTPGLDPEAVARVIDLEACVTLQGREDVSRLIYPERRAAAINKAHAILAMASGSGAISAMLAERQRQIDVEGWTPEHDDGHTGGEIANAAADWASTGHHPVSWSWAKDKAGKTRRRQLVIAGALIIAEIERLERAGIATMAPPADASQSAEVERAGNYGTALDAMEFAFDHSLELWASGEVHDFLLAWRNGELDEYPEFIDWLSTPPAAETEGG